MDEVKSVTDDDEGQLVGELGLLEEVLDPLGVVAIALAANPLHLLDLSRLAGGLDVLEVNLAVLAEVDDGSEEVEESFEALEPFEEVNQGVGRQLLVVLGGDLDADLKVLTNVGRQHGLEAFKRILDAVKNQLWSTTTFISVCFFHQKISPHTTSRYLNLKVQTKYQTWYSSLLICAHGLISSNLGTLGENTVLLIATMVFFEKTPSK